MKNPKENSPNDENDFVMELATNLQGLGSDSQADKLFLENNAHLFSQTQDTPEA